MAIFRKGQTHSTAVAAAMIIGGGSSGMRAALDLADAGLKVFLFERTPCLGGRVAQLGFMFPQHDCVLCRGTSDHGYDCTRPSISPAYIHHNQHPNIEILTNTRVIGVEGEAGDLTASLRQEPRHVDVERCIDCGRCAEVCPIGNCRHVRGNERGWARIRELGPNPLKANADFGIGNAAQEICGALFVRQSRAVVRQSLINRFHSSPVTRSQAKPI